MLTLFLLERRLERVQKFPQDLAHLGFVTAHQHRIVQRVLAPLELRHPEYRLTVDTPEDLILVRNIWEALHGSGDSISLTKVVEYLDSHPEVVEINTNLS